MKVNADALNARVPALILGWLLDIRCEIHGVFHTVFVSVSVRVWIGWQSSRRKSGEIVQRMVDAVGLDGKAAVGKGCPCGDRKWVHTLGP